MSWLERQFGQQGNVQATQKNSERAFEAEMSPGLDGDYDTELREKAALHLPPPLPENMGLEGEYDPNGLAKRVALAFDRDSNLDDIETLDISQEGGTVVFRGSLPDEATLHYITRIAAKVDGAKAIDASQVKVGNRE